MCSASGSVQPADRNVLLATSLALSRLPSDRERRGPALSPEFEMYVASPAMAPGIEHEYKDRVWEPGGQT